MTRAHDRGPVELPGGAIKWGGIDPSCLVARDDLVAWALGVDADMPHARRLLLITLAMVSTPHGLSWLTQEDLATLTRASRGVITAGLKALETERLIRRFTRSLGVGKRASVVLLAATDPTAPTAPADPTVLAIVRNSDIGGISGVPTTDDRNPDNSESSPMSGIRSSLGTTGIAGDQCPESGHLYIRDRETRAIPEAARSERSDTQALTAEIVSSNGHGQPSAKTHQSLSSDTESGHELELFADESPHSEVATRARLAERFETFWNTYPHRGGKKIAKAAASKRWMNMTTADRDRAERNVHHYVASLSARDRQYTPNAANWLDRDAKKETTTFLDWGEPQHGNVQPSALPKPDRQELDLRAAQLRAVAREHGTDLTDGNAALALATATGIDFHGLAGFHGYIGHPTTTRQLTQGETHG